MKKTITAVLMLLVMTSLAWGEDGPRKGYFRKAITPLELLGADGANAIASVFPPDEKLTWQLSVPKNYDPAKPELFKGALFYGDALSWGDNVPPKIDLVRKNRYMFMFGSKDKDRNKMQRIAAAYKAAGVDNTDVVSVANVNRQMPGTSYFERAIEFLDARPQDK